MQKYNEYRFYNAVEKIREKCIRSPRSFRARLLNTILNKIGKVKTKQFIEERKFEEPIAVRKRAIEPSNGDWSSLEKSGRNTPSDNKKVDIICPVYKGKSETLRCIFSVLKAKTEYDYELVVINDMSPEEELTNELRELSKKLHFTYIENKKNLGFLKSTNKGMALHVDRDVVWLNSDTEVFDYWLDSILEIAECDPNVGTITPISNNGTIASYPRPMVDNCQEFEITDSEINEICRNINRYSSVETPTGVGFCMYIRRSVLNKIGYLDEIFNLGYGEENDLCQRVVKNGYKNILTAATFIRHYGSISFGESSIGLCRDNEPKIVRLHPNYPFDAQYWIKSDPIKPLRIKIDGRRLYNEWIRANNKVPKENVLHISHKRGGGTQKFINDLVDGLSKKGISSFILYPSSDKFCEIQSLEIDLPNISRIDYNSGIEELKAALEGLNITKIHIHSFVDWNLIISDEIIEIANILKIQIVISVHDYHWVCSKISLMPNDRQLCNFYSRECCFNCDKYTNISTYHIRKKTTELFKCAERVIVPNEDVMKRLKLFGIQCNYRILPHIEVFQNININPKKGKFKICCVGSMNIAKGRGVIEALSEYIAENRIDATITVIGKTDILLNKVEYLGTYSGYNDLYEKINQLGPSIILFPSIVPETYSYVLTEILSFGLPIAAFNIGAPANRLQCLGMGANLIDISLKNNAEEIYKSLKEISKNKTTNNKLCKEKVSDYDDYYL